MKQDLKVSLSDKENLELQLKRLTEEGEKKERLIEETDLLQMQLKEKIQMLTEENEKMAERTIKCEELEKDCKVILFRSILILTKAFVFSLNILVYSMCIYNRYIYS